MKPSRWVPAMLMLLLSACSSLLNVQRQPFATYSPQYTGTSAAGPQVDWQLIVETPLASATLQTPRMLIMPTPGVLEVFPGARWSDTTPALLRGLIVQGFQASGRILGVGNAQSGMRADFALAIELRDFQIEYRDGKPAAAIRFQASLLDYSSNRVLATQAFSAQTAAASADPASAFSAFQTAVNKVVPELVDWTLHEGNAAHAKPAAQAG